MEKNIIAEHTSVSGTLYVTIDKNLFCLKFNEFIKLEINFDIAPSQAIGEDAGDLRRVIVSENDTIVEETFQDADLHSDLVKGPLNTELQSSVGDEVKSLEVNSNAAIVLLSDIKIDTWESDQNTVLSISNDGNESYEPPSRISTLRTPAKDCEKSTSHSEIDFENVTKFKSNVFERPFQDIYIDSDLGEQPRISELQSSFRFRDELERFGIRSDAVVLLRDIKNDISKSNLDAALSIDCGESSGLPSRSGGINRKRHSKHCKNSSKSKIKENSQSFNLENGTKFKANILDENCDNLRKKSQGREQGSTSNVIKNTKDQVKSSSPFELNVEDFNSVECTSCVHCMKTFTNKKQFQEHYHTQKRYYACEECGLVSSFFSHDVVHQRFSHNIQIPISSEDASVAKKADGSLKLCTKGTRTTSSGKTITFYQCDFCKTEVETLRSMKIHMMIHTNEYTYQCCVCGIQFVHKSQLNKHFAKHFSKYFTENHCITVKEKVRKESTSSLNYDNDTIEDEDMVTLGKTNKNDKVTRSNFSCSYCKTNFKTYTEYVSHHLVPTEGYFCDACGKVFRFKFRYLVHMKSAHNIELPISADSEGVVRLYSTVVNSNGQEIFRCELCFKVAQNISRHMSLHTNELHRKCCVCGMQFFLDSSFRSHMKNHDNDVPNEQLGVTLNGAEKRKLESCSYCSKKFDSIHDYNTHLEVPATAFHCDVCTKPFRSKGHFIVHTNIVHKSETLPSLLDGLEENDQMKGKFLCSVQINDLKEQTYKCNLCNFVTVVLSMLNRHMIKHTNESAFKCCVCGFEDNDSSSFANHLTIHKKGQANKEQSVKIENKEDFYCSYCKKMFKSNSDFKNHYLSVSGAKNFRCDKCIRMFKYKSHLLVHCNVFHNCEAPFPINDPSSDSQLKGILSTKETNNEGDDVYKCNICDVNFTTLDGLCFHFFNHTGESTYKCCVCGLQCRSLSTFKRHVTKHGRSNHIQCKHCDIYFKDRSELLKHQSGHAFQCDLCDIKFENRTSIRFHIKTAHLDDDRLFQCGQCGKRFLSDVTFKSHLRNHRFVKPVQCPVCGIFVIRLNQHLIHHSDAPGLFACDICDMRFKVKNELIKHKLVHSKIRNLTCPQCPKKFPTSSALARHLKVHSEEKPYVCEICGKACKVPGNLRIHMRVHRK